MTVVNSIKNKDIEVNLKEDKSWKKIQQNTFTRWVNQHLKKVDTSIQDLVCFVLLLLFNFFFI